MKSLVTVSIALVLLAAAAIDRAAAAEAGQRLKLYTRSRVKAPGGEFQLRYKTVRWDPKKTAVIVCDMWDKHWCRGATARVAEMAPRMNEFLVEARNRGLLIVHAPSSCTAVYENHPARRRAQNAPPAQLPDCLRGWSRGGLDTEKDTKWPVDQSDGGCDTPGDKSHRAWKRQIDAIEIKDNDAVSDSGVEIGNLLVTRGIQNVIVVGVHTNMCVIGRPFGLRNMVRFGKNVLLVRDMTDSMYNPRRWPNVSHVRGTELVVEHIEKYVCPTITSSDLLGGPAFRFQEDRRPHVAIIVSDDHYHADTTLPAFAQMLRERMGCYCSVLHGQGGGDFPAVDELQKADVLVLFIRRLALPKHQLEKIRAYLAAGKPLVALRTANHAFAPRKLPPGTDRWDEFDKEVLGGNYHGHGPNDAGSDVAVVAKRADHPLLAGIEPARWHSTGSLYYVSPISKDATLLMTGSIEGRSEPLCWTRNHKGGRICYCGLGHRADFDDARFRKLLTNMIFWAMDKTLPNPAAE